jgi:hypothetical protein
MTEAPELGAVVLVTWRDAYFELDEGPPKPDYLVRTVGWVVDTDDLWIAVAAEELPGDDGFRAIMRCKGEAFYLQDDCARDSRDSPKAVVVG